MLINSIAGLPAFLMYFGVGLALVTLYMVVYTYTTAHNEFELIRKDVTAASVSLGLSLVGFALPLSSAIVNSRNLIDATVWGLVALVVQIVVYWLVRLLIRDLSERIARGEMSTALFLGAASLSAGIVNAASMTY